MIVPFELPLPLLLEIGVVVGVYALIARRPKQHRREQHLATQTNSVSTVPQGTLLTR